MSAYILLNLLNVLRTRDKMRGFPCIQNFLLHV